MSRGKEGNIDGGSSGRGGALEKGPRFLSFWPRVTPAESAMRSEGTKKRQQRARAKAKAARKARKRNRA